MVRRSHHSLRRADAFDPLGGDHGRITLALVLSLASAAVYAIAAVLQQRLAARLNRRLGWLVAVRHRGWWVAVVLSAAGGVLHVAALRYGPLTVVQPLGVLTLVLALPLGAMVAGRRVTGAEWHGAAATVAGLGGLVVLTTSAVPTRTLDTTEVATVTAATGATIGLLVLLAFRSRGPATEAVFCSGAAGVAFGISSALTQTFTVDIATDGLTAIGDLATIVIAALVTGAMLLSQAGYRAGLAAPLATSTLANPLAAAVVGLVLLGERFSAGPSGIVVTAAAAILAGYGVAALAGAATAAGPDTHRPSRLTTRRCVPRHMPGYGAAVAGVQPPRTERSGGHNGNAPIRA